MGLVITFSNFILIAYTYVGFSGAILLLPDLRPITRFLGKILFCVAKYSPKTRFLVYVDRVSAILAARQVPADGEMGVAQLRDDSTRERHSLVF